MKASSIYADEFWNGIPMYLTVDQWTLITANGWWNGPSPRAEFDAGSGMMRVYAAETCAEEP